jgi:hypothetical protein
MRPWKILPRVFQITRKEPLSPKIVITLPTHSKGLGKRTGRKKNDIPVHRSRQAAIVKKPGNSPDISDLTSTMFA